MERIRLKKPACVCALLTLALALVGQTCQEGGAPNTTHGRACAGIFCEAGKICDPEAEACVDSDDFCKKVECGPAQTCSRISGACAQDPNFENPCQDVECLGDAEFCFPKTGNCVQEGSDLCDGTNCGIGQMCDADDGRCVEEELCLNVECELWEKCVGGMCVSRACESNGHCPSNMECLYGECTPRDCQDDYQCPLDYPGVCTEGRCEVPECEGDAACEDGEVCALGECAVPDCGPWADGQECAESQVCLDGQCLNPGCTSDEECGAGLECRVFSCVKYESKDCYSDGDCGANGDCVQNICID